MIQPQTLEIRNGEKIPAIFSKEEIIIFLFRKLVLDFTNFKEERVICLLTFVACEIIGNLFFDFNISFEVYFIKL